MTTEERFRPLTDDDLAALRCYAIAGSSVPSALAARLLADRDLWVKRAFDAAGLTDA